MTLSALLTCLDRDPAFSSIRDLAEAGTGAVVEAPAAVHPLVVAEIARRARAGAPVIVVTATGREAEDVATALPGLLPRARVAVFPSWETLPHERLSPSSDTVGRRVAVMRRLAHPDPSDELCLPIDVLVTSVRAFLQPVILGIGDVEPVRLQAGDEVPLTDLVTTLVELGYERVDLVERRGQVAVRGGILDVFPPTEEHPLRVEFWGDSVEEVRTFAIADQRSLELAPHGLWAPAVRELLLTPQVRARAAALAERSPHVAEMCDKLAQGMPVEGMESLAPVLADGMTTPLELVAGSAQVVLLEPERIRKRAHDVVRTAQEFLMASWHNATVGNSAPIDVGAASYRELDDMRGIARVRMDAWWQVTPLWTDAEIDDDADARAPGRIRIDARELDTYRGDSVGALADMRDWTMQKLRVVLLAEGQGSVTRMVEELAGAGIAVLEVADLQVPPDAGLVTVTRGRLVHGFALESCGLTVITETDIVGQRTSTKDMRRLPSRRRRAIDPLTLKSGDFVVHEQHGVGRYVDMVQRAVAGAEREYLVLEYAASKRGQPPDRLFVPMDQLDLITRYVGGEAPTVHRLGGADWQKAKGRARKAVKQIAGELIRLYAARQASKGYAFAADTPWQRELEDAFPYVETPDQQSCIDEVKADMERTVPMDRLICGDVGYGKTEIAVRAAFKAVQDGKQVAVLVPTTLLVQQHLSTFAERYAAFPIKVAALSRFSTDKDAKSALEGVADGTVDVVIGTHRLLTSGVRFKDLGLVVIDEEQRFGVEHKEHLKALRTNVDVLAMSATPIPRTLEMAVTGIREMSVIQTPPEERHPVLTFVGPYDDRQITAAINRELMREGQVFFVHNRVESIDRVARRIADMVPDARIAVAHGQMNEHALEQVIVDFWDKQIDVLVCTTIVESGIDIANANTLIVDRADTFGLSQLHQLRGRVGRGRERAYAYFLYAPDKPLTETAHERLATIAQHTDLGSGMHIAMKDLEIRGAGNMLGGEQSGHIADVGFDLYVRLVGEALAEYKDEPTAPAASDVKVELPIDAHIPAEYVPHERLRLEAYKRLADASSDAAVDEVASELLDRYGPLPSEVEALLAVARFRVLARSAGLTEVILQASAIRFHPVTLPESGQMRLTRLYPRTLVKPTIRTIMVPRPTTALMGGTPLRDTELLSWATELVKAVLQPAPPMERPT
ncbi:MAG: transcription-repair coupling factor [Actinobacteria bacterium]|nr:transcription-repair coupling factor [Actinomycetota bacterium]